jgi:molybdate transport system regulatory protein
MGMSYKRAWVLVHRIKRAFTEPVVTAASGGVRGSGASLAASKAEVLGHHNHILDRITTIARL